MGKSLPGWMPEEVRHYLAHVENGAPLRALARASGCHPSTIMRQVRRMESRRDDPLVDAALRQFGNDKETKSMDGPHMPVVPVSCDDETLEREAIRVLRRMCESGAVLAVVPDMEKAVVVRETPSGTTQRVAVVDTAIAQAMALKDWIGCKTPGRISRYAITATGRTALSQLLARAESQRSAEVSGLADAAAPFTYGKIAEPTPRPTTRRVRYGLAETPLSVLARRRGRDGKPFLEPDLVAAGERLREDFELAQMGPKVTQNWSAFLTGPVDGGGSMGGHASSDAKKRVEEALYDLGPGLGDMALRCCCQLEGLEAAERDMGWAARSGKVVLRIALQRLKRFYESKGGSRSDMIG
ncbi:DUF6456 domain-containing protein [Primorskyibacter sp. S187A]|uniref:DUF6456 domain-containing protein n=1 Tax=Primorskyibacter sp. S187A TaxID=3415130 RepID=UPI003C7CB3DC